MINPVIQQVNKGSGSGGGITLGYGLATEAGATAVSLTDASSYITASVKLNITFKNLTSLTLAPGTWLLNAKIQVNRSVAALAGVLAWLGPTSASYTHAYVGQQVEVGNVAGGSEWTVIPLTAIVTLATSTTVYLGAQALKPPGTTATTAAHTVGTGSNCTGITAVRIK